MSGVFRNSVRNFSAHGCKPSKSVCSKSGEKTKKVNPGTCIVGPSGVYPTIEGGYKIYRNIFLFVCIPLVGLCAYNTFTNHKEPERPPFAKLEYMRIRTKKFPWCGGTDRSFFHNPRLNALPEGYEELDEED